MAVLEYSLISDIAQRHGLSVLGVADCSELTNDRKFLESWQQNGYAGNMHYMNRSADLLANPHELAPWARSIIVFSVNYSQQAPHELPSGYGRVARYAWGRDYHKVIKKLVTKVAEEISTASSQMNFKVHTDSVPALERALAKRAGLGFIGKNSMLIQPKIGSFFFIAEIFTDAVVEGFKSERVDVNCGTCSSCKSACPTNAIVSDYTVDARKCISYLTIERKDAFNEWEREALGEWIFGCDICQEVCPFNHTSLKEQRSALIEELDHAAGVGPLLSLEEVLKLRTSDQFLECFAGTPLMRPKRAGLLRNAMVVAANTKSDSLYEAILTCAQHDSSPIVRQHALWALFRLEQHCNLGKRKELINLFCACKNKEVDSVTEEAEQLLERFE